ncbi:MAG: GDP-mannose 4,6-dehydratase [Candidatus Hydrogenedentes bacterium]|nr:GDP-mannose 4,6-dehydratase [Candidatus Hydrogenedentota bacterium]
MITGAGGFIGSHLAESCVQLGYRVRAFVHYNSGGTWGWLDNSPLKDSMEIVSGDIRDADSVRNAMKGARSVFHLAALIGIPYSYVSPLAYLRTNIEGAYNILEAARDFQLDRVIVTSTSETYGTAQSVPIGESHPAVGQSPYAATKIGADQLALSYHRSFGLPVWVVRPFNTYGPRQSARAFIPSTAMQLLAGEQLLRVGNLAPTRDLTFVEDTAAGFLAIAGAESLMGSATNVGMGSEISMEALLWKIAEMLNTKPRIEIDACRVRPESSEVERLYCDNSRLLAQTGWRPRYTLDTGLERTLAWLRENMGSHRPAHYSY